MPSVVYKQVWSVIDERTTIVCLNAAGQTRPVDQPFDTLNGQYDSPPFHIGCRSVSVPFLLGSPDDQRTPASQELARRPETRGTRTSKLPLKPRGGRRGLSPKKRRRTQPKVPTKARQRRAANPGVRRAPVKRRNTNRRRR